MNVQVRNKQVKKVKLEIKKYPINKKVGNDELEIKKLEMSRYTLVNSKSFFFEFICRKHNVLIKT